MPPPPVLGRPVGVVPTLDPEAASTPVDMCDDDVPVETDALTFAFTFALFAFVVLLEEVVPKALFAFVFVVFEVFVAFALETVLLLVDVVLVWTLLLAEL